MFTPALYNLLKLYNDIKAGKYLIMLETSTGAKVSIKTEQDLVRAFPLVENVESFTLTFRRVTNG